VSAPWQRAPAARRSHSSEALGLFPPPPIVLIGVLFFPPVVLVLLLFFHPFFLFLLFKKNGIHAFRGVEVEFEN